MAGKFVVTVVCLIFGAGLGQFVELNDEQRLTNKLLSITEQTGVYARPVMNVTDTLPVSFGIGLFKILNFIEKDANQATVKLLTLHRYRWVNHQLQWNPEDFGGLRETRLHVDKMWRPDLKLLSSLDVSHEQDKGGLAVVYNNGDVLWVPSAIDEVPCDKDTESDPWVCVLNFASWTYNGNQLSLNFFENLRGFDMGNSVALPPVDVVEQSATNYTFFYPCCPQLYFGLAYTLKLSEK